MRVAVVDIGTNSTRLLIADVDANGAVTELERRSEVTRLGAGVDATGELSDDAIERVFETLDAYREAIDSRAVDATAAVLTSAARDASNGAWFAEQLRTRYGFEARVIAGDEEARLTFLGAMSERPPDAREPTVVIDIGGGSTEFVIGTGRTAGFHVSARLGVVRFTERHIKHDPPQPEELQALADEARAVIETAVPAAQRAPVTTAIAVAGTATSLAAIAQELDPYDPAKVHGYVLDLGACELLLARLAAMTDEQRRHVVGLDPGRAPTIVAGAVILIEALRAFDLDRVEVSEHDILRGVALRRAGVA